MLEKDILVAGGHMNSRDALRLLVEGGRPVVESLLRQELGVDFSRNAIGEIDLTREAAHSVRRIYHVTDASSRAIEEALVRTVTGSGSVAVFPNTTAVDLITNVHNSRDAREKYRHLRVIGA